MMKSLGLRILRIFVLSLREFANDNCTQRASSLTFFSLLSIVPVFAMAFGVAKGFGFEHTLETRVMERFHGQEEVATRLIQFAQAMLENAQGGVIAGVGITFLFWAVIRMLSNIELAFNTIWGVKRERTWGRKFTDYLSLFLICPVLLIISGSLTVFITTQIQHIAESVRFFGYFSGLIFWALSLLPTVIIWGLLTFIYMFMPNTRVKLLSALTGGIVAGTIYQIVQWVYINFQIGASKYGAVYGSFAAIPLFLIWLQLSWLIVLYGAEIAFAHQNEATYEFEPHFEKVSRRFKDLLALQITHFCVARFVKGEKAANTSMIADYFEIPVRLSRQILMDLVDARILVEVQPSGEVNKDEFYQPAKDVNELTVHSVLDALDKNGMETIQNTQTPEFERLKEYLEKERSCLGGSSNNLLLKDL